MIRFTPKTYAESGFLAASFDSAKVIRFRLVASLLRAWRNNMDQELKDIILAHAKIEFPREACGLLVICKGKEIYFPCRNLAENQNDFIMDPEHYAMAEEIGDVVGVVHSHPNASAKPSQADLVSCEASGLPWYILSLPSETWETIEPTGYEAPLVGRQFVHGVLDCYSLIRDWYRKERGIELVDFERREEWWNKGDNLYLDNFRKAGFEPVDVKDIQAGDVILMQIGARVVNHAAVYLGRDMMLHHLMNRLSSREIWGGWFRKNTRLVIRFKGTA